jgi:hypothetical protein
MKKFLMTVCLAGLPLLALAKLPAPVLSDEAKAKAAEAAAKTAWTGKVEAFQLCKAQDKVAASYYKTAKASGKEVKPPVAAPACAEPGPFVYTPPEAKPIEAAGAHSPAGTATSPPSTKQPDAVVNPAKKS